MIGCAGCSRSNARVALSCETGQLHCERCYAALLHAAYCPTPGATAGEGPVRRRQRQDEPWIAFRKQIIGKLQRDGCCHYVDRDRFGGCCPICGDPLAVRFVGRTPRAELRCQRGCDELEVVGALGKANR